nr:MAG TPA: carbohydrate binding domain protein [Caudoviricetes sp.]
MYNPGGEYLTYIKDSIIRKPRSKIVVDGKTYTGLEHLVSFPKITHETEKMIGGFPAKTCEFEIYNLDGSLDLNGKEVQVYRGLDISDTKTVWVPMGLFYADGEDVMNNSTKRTIQFKGTDRTRLFDTPFTKIYGNGVIPAETLISSVAEKICRTHNLAIDSATKRNIVSHRLSESVGVPEGTTDRQVIAWIAELSGCIPIISRDGGSLVFTRPNYKSNVYDSGQTYPSGSYANKSKYKTLSAEPLFGPINAVSFGHADYDDAYVYQNDADVETNGLHEWQINDNPLAENSKAELAPKVFNIIKGIKLYPFTLTDFIDDFLFDINDGILIKKKDDTLITTYVLGMSTTSRIRSSFKSNTQDSSTADRSLAGSVKEDLKRVKLIVDHTKAEITAFAKESEEKFAQLTLTTDGLYADINDAENGLKAAMTATAEKAESAFEKATAVENAGYVTTEDAKTLISQSADNITLAVEQNIKIGARNILLDSACFASLPVTGRTSTIDNSGVALANEPPSGRYRQFWFRPTSDGTRGFQFFSSGLIGENDGEIAKIKPNTTYTLSWWMKYNSFTALVPGELSKSNLLYVGDGKYVIYDDQRCTLPAITDSWQRYTATFKTPSEIPKFSIRFFFANCKKDEYDTGYKVCISSFKLEEGNITTDWTPSAEDVEQSVKAQISMCVLKDENGKLESEIKITSNKLTIDTDNFTLDGNGNMTCVNAEIKNATISGTIAANDAILGGWHIAENELYSEYGGCTAHIKAPQSSSEYFFAVRESLGDGKYTSNFAINTDGSVFMNNLVAAEIGITIKTYHSKSKGYVDNLTFHGLTQNNKYYDAITAAHDLTIGANSIELFPNTGIYLQNNVYLTSYASGVSGKAALYVDTKTGEITVEN